MRSDRRKRVSGKGEEWRRLRQAGAVLVAKLASGAMAFDDVWWGGEVKNPWNIAEGASGSSAGLTPACPTYCRTAVMMLLFGCYAAVPF